MNRKAMITFVAVLGGAALGYLGSCVARSDTGREHAGPAAAHRDYTLSTEHQSLLDVVERQRNAPAQAVLDAEETSGSSPRQGG